MFCTTSSSFFHILVAVHYCNLFRLSRFTFALCYTIAQVVIGLLTTAVAQAPSQVRSYGICGAQSATAAGVVPVLPRSLCSSHQLHLFIYRPVIKLYSNVK
jgi:hypothetical protein